MFLNLDETFKFVKHSRIEVEFVKEFVFTQVSVLKHYHVVLKQTMSS